MRGVDEGDRAAVAVPDQDRLRRVQPVEHGGEDVERLLVEEGRGPRGGGRLRPAVAEPRERDEAPAGRLGERVREAAPEADRAEPLVQEDEGPQVRVTLQIEHLDLTVAGEPHAGLVSIRSRSRKRCTLPVSVRGSSSTNSTTCGYS